MTTQKHWIPAGAGMTNFGEAIKILGIRLPLGIFYAFPL